MRLIWEEKDVKAGMIVKKPATMGKGYLIGKKSIQNEWYLVSLDDGTVLGPCTKKWLADTLTDNGDLPFDFLRVWNEVQ